MNKYTHFSFKSVIAIFFIIIILPNNIFPWRSSNTTESAFSNDGKFKSTLPMDYYIVKGAAAFLDSYSQTLLYMQKTETMALKGIDQEELKSILENAISSIKTANDLYRQLKKIADCTPYNKSMIDNLKNFDYERFILANNDTLDKKTFAEARGYLISGNIRGIYARMGVNAREIERVLNRIYKQTEAGEIPAIKDTWRVNQLFSKSLMFGQYVTRVFQAITN